MDPNANLTEQRQLAQRLLDSGLEHDPDYLVNADRLAELVVSLDQWIRNGGALPDAWVKATVTR